jgi:hypothetical protein
MLFQPGQVVGELACQCAIGRLIHGVPWECRRLMALS